MALSPKQQIENLYGRREAAALSRWALEQITGRSTAWVLAHKDDLTEQQKTLYHNVLERLATGEPIQYIFHAADFCGLQLYVDGRVLIPRPETAELVEWILEDYATLRGCRQCVVVDGSRHLRLVDACTGSGCIALALKRANPQWDITAFDISADALQVAQKNSKDLCLPLTLKEQDLAAWADAEQDVRYDIIVSNPPYIMPQEASTMHTNVLDHEPHLALFVPQTDPLEPYRALARATHSHLTTGGHLYCEINPLLVQQTVQLFEQHGLSTTVRNDFNNRQRFIRCILS